ncbi:MAG: hypothetical protein ACK5F8_02155, partial [Bradyrhizobium sp.]|uniref:hypothetical protein n=2 Tax=Bradyrhizobium sp. TaxID=376 RepID=UPI00391A67BD
MRAKRFLLPGKTIKDGLQEGFERKLWTLALNVRLARRTSRDIGDFRMTARTSLTVVLAAGEGTRMRS